MNPLLLSQILNMIRWGVDAIEAQKKGEKTEDEIMAEHAEMQKDFSAAVARWKNPT